MNFYELYLKSGFGRRIRRVASVAGMRKIAANLWTSIAGYGYDVPPDIYPPVTTGEGTATAIFSLPPIGLPTEMTVGFEGSYIGDPATAQVDWMAMATAPKNVADIIAAMQADPSFPPGVTLAETPGGISATVATGVITKFRGGWVVMLP